MVDQYLGNLKALRALAFDAGDVLEAYLDDIAEKKAEEEAAPKEKSRPPAKGKRRRVKVSR